MDTSQSISHLVVELGWTEVWVGVLLLGAVQFLIALWLKSRLEASIKHEYDKRLEEFRFDLKAREQAAKVAELFAEARDNDPTLSPDRARKLNRYAWELSLWLPADTVREITRQLVFAPDRKDVKELLIMVRRHILRDRSDGLTANDIVHFLPNEKKSTDA
jgi:hypothetical protein